MQLLLALSVLALVAWLLIGPEPHSRARVGRNPRRSVPPRCRAPAFVPTQPRSRPCPGMEWGRPKPTLNF